MFSRYTPPAISVPCQRAYATVSGTLARMRLLPNAKLLNISESISDFSHLIIKVSCIWKLKKLKRLEESNANVPFPHPTPDIAHRASTCTIFAFPNAPECASTQDTGKSKAITQNKVCKHKHLTIIVLHKNKPSCAIITNRFLPTKGGFTPKTRLICNASKPSLAHKTDSTDLERSLVCMADEPHPTENRTLLRHKMPKFRIANPGRTAGNETPHVK